MANVTAISSLGWAHYTLYEALPRMAAMGFKRVEFASFYSYCFHFNFGSPTPKELRRMLDEYHMTAICLNYCGGLYEAWRPEEIARFVRDVTRKIEHLSDAGIPMMTMQGFGWRNQRRDRKRQLANAVKAFDRLGKVGARHGVRMLLEVPHLYQILTGTEATRWVFQRLSSPNVGALVDSSHWGVIGYDIDEFFAALGDRLWHIHLRDSKGAERDPQGYELELTPGRGEVDFRTLATALDKFGYRGDVSLEFEYRDASFDTIAQEFRRGLHQLKQTGWKLPSGVRARGKCHE